MNEGLAVILQQNHQRIRPLLLEQLDWWCRSVRLVAQHYQQLVVTLTECFHQLDQTTPILHFSLIPLMKSCWHRVVLLVGFDYQLLFTAKFAIQLNSWTYYYFVILNTHSFAVNQNTSSLLSLGRHLWVQISFKVEYHHPLCSLSACSHKDRELQTWSLFVPNLADHWHTDGKCSLSNNRIAASH